MQNTLDPWFDLAPGGVDSRRVDSTGRWNFFWSVTVDSHRALVLRVAALPKGRPDLPRLRSLDLRFQGPGAPALVLILRDRAQTALFATLCRDIIAAAQDASDEEAAMSRFIARTARWHHLLRGGGPGMSEERQKGLIAELKLLVALSRVAGSTAALAAWGGPFGAQKDFDDGRVCIEVKSIRSAAKPKVRIASEHQLADVAERQLLLAVLPVDRAAAPEGSDLHAHVAEAARALAIQDSGQQECWEQALAASGYRDEDETLKAFMWKTGNFRFFEVGHGFPRLLPPLPEGVSDLSYSIDLSSGLAFERETPFRPANEEQSIA